MSVTIVTGPRSWRYDLSGRDRDFALFFIPSDIVTACAVVPNTKRLVSIRLSSGRQLRGYCSITSGTEMYIPTRFREEFRRAAWFECEIIGHDLAESPSLQRMAS